MSPNHGSWEGSLPLPSPSPQPTQITWRWRHPAWQLSQGSSPHLKTEAFLCLPAEGAQRPHLHSSCRQPSQTLPFTSSQLSLPESFFLILFLPSRSPHVTASRKLLLPSTPGTVVPPASLVPAQAPSSSPCILRLCLPLRRELSAGRCRV